MNNPAPRILVLDRTNELAARLRHHVVAAETTVRGCRDAARAEAQLPGAGDDELGRALLRATRITRSRRGITAGGHRPGPRGRTVMVASASGGCGKTFVATNTSAFLACTIDQPVVLFDLDLQFGEVSTALRLRPEATIIDALAAEAEGYELDQTLDDFLLTHPDGFKILAAPRRPAEADSVTPGDVARILAALRARGAWVVVDTHEGLSDLFTAALAATGYGAEHVAIPYSRDVSRSINVGVPLIIGKPKSKISVLLDTELSTALLEPRTPLPEPECDPAEMPVPEPECEPVEVPVPDVEREPQAPRPFVEIDLTDGRPYEFDLAESPSYRGRGPPCPISPRSNPLLVPH